MVSNILKISKDFKEIYPMIIGCIGHYTASNFKTWVELYENMPSVEAIFDGKEVDLPKASELQIALRSAMVAYARTHPEKTLIDNSIDFACKLPWTFRGKLMHDYYYIPEVRPIIAENEVFIMAKRNGQR